MTTVNSPPRSLDRRNRAAAALLRRLLQDDEPLLADELRGRPTDAGLSTLLEHVAGRAPLRRVAVASRSELAVLADRAICLPTGAAPLLLELGRDGGCAIDLGTGPRRVDAAVVEEVFPCTAWYLAPSTASGSAPSAPGTALSLYLRLTAQVLGLAMPVALMLVIDKVVTQGAENTLRALLAGVTLLTVFQYAFQWLQLEHSTRQTERLAHPVRCGVFEALLSSRQAARAASQGWDVLEHCGDAARFSVETRSQHLADAGFAALLGVLMVAFSPTLTVVSALFVPAYLALQAWGGHGGRRLGASLTERRSQIAARHFEALGAAEFIRSMNLAGYVAARWREADAVLAAERYRLTLRRRRAALWVEFLQRVSVIVVMLLGVAAVIDGAMTLGQYIAFNLLSMQLAQPVLRMAGYPRARDDHQGQQTARGHLLEQCRSSPWPGGALPVSDREAPTLQAEDVVLGSEDGATLSFSVLGGTWLGVVGPSGCGKSTLLRAVAGLEQPRRGCISINGRPVGRLAPAALARHVCLVPQSPVVFSASLAENLRLGDRAASLERIAAVAEACGLMRLADSLPAHLNTQVGAAGRALSGGERQRLALGRALLAQPGVLLLDEATAALDAPAEAEILCAVRRLLPRAVVVVVAHRSSSLAGCRQVLRIHPGPNAGDCAAVAATG